MDKKYLKAGSTPARLPRARAKGVSLIQLMICLDKMYPVTRLRQMVGAARPLATQRNLC